MDLILSITTAFLISFSAVPIVIRIFRSIDLLDAPDRRKIHTVSTPSLGGIAIYLGFMISISFWVPLAEIAEVKFVLLAAFFMFLLGIRDDISSLQALDKLTIQVFSALLIVFVADIKFSGLYGLLGLHALPIGIAEFLSLFVIVGMANAFNLIDGIDGLAGSIAVLVFGFFGFWFFQTDHVTLGFIASTLSAAVLGFLFFNWAPSKIFMGDTGSMVLGFMLAVLMIQFIEMNSLMTGTFYKVQAPVALSFALLVLPVYDTLRVFAIRLVAGKSPMSADKNHTHHSLLKLGFSHSNSTLILMGFNISVVLITWFLQPLGNNWLCLIILLLSIGFGLLLDRRLGRRIKSMRKESVSSTIG